MAFFSHIEQAPLDPIFGVTVAFNGDSRPEKVNLGVGIYRTADLKPALLKVVHEVEIEIAQAGPVRAYLPIEGNRQFVDLIGDLVLGADKASIEGLTGAQTLGGTSALRIAGEFLARLTPATAIYLPDPSWENHRAVFNAAGLEVRSYDYYDRSRCVLATAAMLRSLQQIPEGSPVMFHASCHNPTGIDPTLEQWHQILEIVQSRRLVPVFDCAYQGYGDGIEEDVASIRAFARAGLDMFVCYSCSKNFGLYGERVGALLVLGQTLLEAQAIGSQVNTVIRSIYSNPPFHGAKVVETILSSPERRKQWLKELISMQSRLHEMRKGLVAGLQANVGNRDFGFLSAQRGLFSFMGLTRDQVQRLSAEYAIYTPSSGRINVAGLNSDNLGYVAEAIASIL